MCKIIIEYHLVCSHRNLLHPACKIIMVYLVITSRPVACSSISSRPPTTPRSPPRCAARCSLPWSGTRPRRSSGTCVWIWRRPPSFACGSPCAWVSPLERSSSFREYDHRRFHSTRASPRCGPSEELFSHDIVQNPVRSTSICQPIFPSSDEAAESWTWAIWVVPDWYMYVDLLY